MGITDAPRCSNDSNKWSKESAKRARLHRPRSGQCAQKILVEGLDSDSHRRGVSRVGHYAMRAMDRSVNAMFKRPAPRDSSDPREIYIAAMWLMFCRAPGHKTGPGEPNRGILVALLHADLSWRELSKENEQSAVCRNDLYPQRGLLQQLKPSRIVLGSLNPAQTSISFR